MIGFAQTSFIGMNYYSGKLCGPWASSRNMYMTGKCTSMNPSVKFHRGDFQSDHLSFPFVKEGYTNLTTTYI